MGFDLESFEAWNYMNGFPKSHNVSIAIDKLFGVESEEIMTDEALKHLSYGTALKPSWEIFLVGRKPGLPGISDGGH